jgi:phenylalanyl-tRNA synthetase beta chain
MKISYNWLKQYVNPIPAPAVVAELLTGGGLEVEGIGKFQKVKGGLEGVVIGEVKTCEKHPNSDHLTLTTVDVGKNELLKIVCGAPNVAAGQKVTVALVGTTLYLGDKELTLQKSKIRGEVSEGMICAEDELGLGSSHQGIMVLDPEAKPGTPAKEYFNIEDDFIFEIGLTPNRADAASHIGVARDLVALLGTNKDTQNLKAGLRLPDISGFTIGRETRKIKVIIEDPLACPRYSGLTMTGITVKESPDWLKNRLNSIGLRPINNIVDCTNYILHEIGQPLHAFDADKISGDQVVIKKLNQGKRFITLDGVEKELSGQDLMICNSEEPMCIAGVFGGIQSGVTEETKNIFLESAYFDPRTIRKTARHHGLQTDASFRFERGADIEITIYALKRAALLISEITGGTIASEIEDIYPQHRPRNLVTLFYSHLDRLVGKVIERTIVKKILLLLEINILAESEEDLHLEIPSFKVDVHREADVIEEILRIYGYNNVETGENIRGTLTITRNPDPEKIQNMVSEFLCDNGFFEIMNNSLTRSSYYTENINFPLENCIRMLNPLSRDLDVLRQTMLYGGLETINYNQNRKIPDIKVFEFGNCYIKQDKVPVSVKNTDLDKYLERKHLALFLAGRRNNESWNADDLKISFYDLKNYINQLLVKTGYDFSKNEIQDFSSGLIREGLVYRMKDTEIVTFGILSESLLSQFDCNQAVLYADFDWDALIGQLDADDIETKELPKFPEVRRDLALLLDQSVTFSEIEKLALQTEKHLLKKVGLFDVFEGEKIGAGKKSYALYFILQDDKKTLTDKDIDKGMNRLIQCFQDKLGAQLR